MGDLIEAIYAHKLDEERARGALAWPSQRYATDPIGFCVDVLGFMPTAAQSRIMTAVVDHPRVSVRSGRRVGKSRVCAALALWKFCKDPDATVVLIAPTERQIVEIVWHDVVSLFHNSGRCLACRLRNPSGPRPCPHSACVDGALSASVRTGLRAGDRRLFGMSPRNAEHVRGIAGRNQSYWIDEGSGIADEIHEQCDGNTAGGGQIAAFGQPSNPVGWFARTFDDEHGHWHHIHVSSLSSPNIVLRRTVVPNLADAEWAARKLAQWGENHPAYRCEVLGEMPSQDARRLLTEVDYAAAVERNGALPIDGEPLAFGIDPASGSEGGDASTIAMRRGWRMWPVHSFHGGTDRIVHELRELIRLHRKSPREMVFLPFDCEGAPGAALRIALNEMRRKDDFLKPEPLESGRGGVADAHLLKRAGVYDRRALYWWSACQRLKTHAGIVHDEELREELLFPYFEADQSKGSRLPDKRRWRSQFSRSPDKADATIYCLWNGELPPSSEAAAEYERAMAEPEAEVAPRPFDPFDVVRQQRQEFDPYASSAFGDVYGPRRNR